jgi:hypothetical protein
MRSFQVFAAMSDSESEAFFGRIKQAAPTIFQQSVAAAAASLKMRPAFVKKQPFAKQVAYVRRALSRVAANVIADETLAMYFLEVKKELLTEWLDQVGVAHEDGTLTEHSPAEPAAAVVEEATMKFRGADDDPDRELLLRAFAAQSSIEWPTLDALIRSKLPV